VIILGVGEGPTRTKPEERATACAHSPAVSQRANLGLDRAPCDRCGHRHARHARRFARLRRLRREYDDLAVYREAIGRRTNRRER